MGFLLDDCRAYQRNAAGLDLVAGLKRQAIIGN
jgi:hypothetical protein